MIKAQSKVALFLKWHGTKRGKGGHCNYEWILETPKAGLPEKIDKMGLLLVVLQSA
jgi:hypothetical protein